MKVYKSCGRVRISEGLTRRAAVDSLLSRQERSKEALPAAIFLSSKGPFIGDRIPKPLSQGVKLVEKGLETIRNGANFLFIVSKTSLLLGAKPLKPLL
jgi:hypothetical protein